MLNEAVALESVMGTIRTEANKLLRKLPVGCILTRDDLIAEGQMEALKAIRAYDERTGGKLNTFVTCRVRNRCYHIMRDMYMRAQVVTTDMETMAHATTDVLATEVGDLVDTRRVSHGALQMLKLVLNGPQELKGSYRQALAELSGEPMEKVDEYVAELRAHAN